MEKTKVYSALWRNKWITSEAKTIDDFIETYQDLAAMFSEWKEKGIVLNPESGISDDYAEFTTEDPKVADEFGFIEDLWEDCECEDCECEDIQSCEGCCCESCKGETEE
jgi:hypothetical protein